MLRSAPRWSGLEPWFVASLVVHACLALAWMETPVTVRPSAPQPSRVDVRVVARAEPAPPPETVTAPAHQPAPPPKPKPAKRARKVAPPPPVVPQPRTPEPVAEAPVTETVVAESAAPVATPAPVAAPPPSVDEEHDALAEYIATIGARVKARKRYPSMARRRGLEGTSVATISIDASGRITGIDLGGEAAAVLQRSTREAVERAGPFPAPPQGAVKVRIPLRYTLRD